MLWLIAALILLQTAIHWLFEPVVQLLTPLVGFQPAPMAVCLGWDLDLHGAFKPMIHVNRESRSCP
jgi:hypothetical protein